jgi:hypothetical protein
MDPKFFRKYADIITEAENTTQLNEGVINTVMQYAQKLVQQASPALMQKVSALVSTALGKPAAQLTMADVTLANAKKVLAANQQMSEAEEYQNPTYNYIDTGYERADIPGTLGANQKTDAKIGGVVGLFAGSMISAAIPGLMSIGLPVLGLAVIAGAIIGYKMASPDKGLTGRFKRDDGSFATSMRPAPNAEPEPLERDPRFNQNR